MCARSPTNKVHRLPLPAHLAAGLATGAALGSFLGGLGVGPALVVVGSVPLAGAVSLAPTRMMPGAPVGEGAGLAAPAPAGRAGEGRGAGAAAGESASVLL